MMGVMRQDNMTFLEETSLDVVLFSRNALLADIYRLKLEMDGYRVSTFQGLRDWRARPMSWHPDLVFVDITDETGSPIAELDRLRLDPSLRHAPFVILSHRTAEDLAQLGLSLGPTEHLLRTGVPELGHLFVLEDQRTHAGTAS